LGKSPSVDATLEELGLEKDAARAVGQHNFEDKWPANDRAWKERFYLSFGFLRLAKYYARHPLRAVDIILQSVREYGRDFRPLLLANLRREDGFAAGTKTAAFSWWSQAKTTVLREYPLFLLFPYAVMPLWLARFRRSQFAMPVILAWS